MINNEKEKIDYLKEYTVLWFDYELYHKNKVKVKAIISKYGLVWNTGKVKLMTNEEMMESIHFFGLSKKIEEDSNLKGRGGSSGVWKSDKRLIKIIMFEKRNIDEHLPVILIYKNTENEFSDSENENDMFLGEFVNYCLSIGVSVSLMKKAEEGKLEEIYEKKLNIDLIKDLNNIDKKKEVMINNFKEEMYLRRNCEHKFSDKFIDGWTECIRKYG